jgi:hypothetical protein
MRTARGLLAIAVTILALMGFASSAAAATDGVVRDVTTSAIIPENRELHAVGWWGFQLPSGSFICHFTSNLKATGATGTTLDVTNFSIPDVTKCSVSNGFSECHLSESATDNLPSHATVTPPGAEIPAGDLDVTGSIGFTWTFSPSSPFCPFHNTSVSIVTSTMKPLKTGTKVVTGTSNTLGSTASLNDPIAGFEISSLVTVSYSDGSFATMVASGELELTSPDRCTWKITSA